MATQKIVILLIMIVLVYQWQEQYGKHHKRMSEATTDAEFTMLWLLDYTRNRINDASMFMVQAKCTFSSQAHLKYHWIMESFTDKVWPNIRCTFQRSTKTSVLQRAQILHTS